MAVFFYAKVQINDKRGGKRMWKIGVAVLILIVLAVFAVLLGFKRK